MRLGKYLSSLTKPEIDELRELLNLSDECGKSTLAESEWSKERITRERNIILKRRNRPWKDYQKNSTEK